MSDDRPVVRVDPAVRFGRPNMNGISTEALADQWLAGSGEEEILDDYTLTRHELLVALWFEGTQGAPRFRKVWKPWADEVAYPVLSGWDKRHVDEVPMPPIGSAVSGATCPSP